MELLAAAGAEVDATDQGGVNALHAVASLGQDDCLKAVVRLVPVGDITYLHSRNN